MKVAGRTREVSSPEHLDYGLLLRVIKPLVAPSYLYYFLVPCRQPHGQDRDTP